MDQESNPLPRPFCPDMKECLSEEIVHYSRFRCDGKLLNYVSNQSAVILSKTGCKTNHTKMTQWRVARWRMCVRKQKIPK